MRYIEKPCVLGFRPGPLYHRNGLGNKYNVEGMYNICNIPKLYYAGNMWPQSVKIRPLYAFLSMIEIGLIVSLVGTLNFDWRICVFWDIDLVPGPFLSPKYKNIWVKLGFDLSPPIILYNSSFQCDISVVALIGLCFGVE